MQHLHARIAGLGLIITLAGACASRSQDPPEPSRAKAPVADLVLRGGNIVTVDEHGGTVHALAARGERILATGSDDEIAAFVGDATTVIDLQGATAIPGFIEGHAHFTGIGQAVQTLDLTRARSWDDVVAMVAEAVDDTSAGEWILGRGWHQEKWQHRPTDAVEGFPTHHSLSAVSPDNPVFLTHASGHASFFNARAMALAGVTAATPDPAGGQILKDDGGQPIGVFLETAQGLVRRTYTAEQLRLTPDERAAQLHRTIGLADRECLSKGITSLQDAGSSLRTIDTMLAMAERGEIGTRLWVMIRARNAQLAGNLDRYKMIGAAGNHLTVRAIKRSIDGALGSRGAWLLEPYSDAPDSTGLATATVASVTETAQLAQRHGYQLCVHAIGDRANREVLDIFASVLGTSAGASDHRWRIEHAQHLSAADIPRFGQLGVIASMQGVHCTSDAPYVVARLGPDRAAEGAYVWQKLLQSGAMISNGTDAPVEDVDPIASFHASVSRRLADGTVFYPDQRMSRMEALQSYTIHAAYAAFEEHLKGSLVPGKLADVVVLSHDITTIPEDQILDTEVLYTIVGGQVLYDRRRG